LASWPELPEVSVRVATAEFETYTGTAFTTEDFAASWWTEGPFLDAAMAAVASTGLDPSPHHYSFCTNGSFTAGIRGIPTLGFGAGAENMAHQVDEHVTLDSIGAVARGLAAISLAVVGDDALAIGATQ
jgi:acetylornithine deacetylase/succinyl-diaminopimelate desuccinylase-like protein